MQHETDPERPEVAPPSRPRAELSRREPPSSTHPGASPDAQGVDHPIYSMQPGWRAYTAGFMGDATTAQYFDEVGLEAIPLRYPLDPHDLGTLVYVQEEHGCHATWCTETSGCIQRGLSLVGTEAMITLVTKCLREQRKITLPLERHPNEGDRWMVERILASDAALRVLKLNDLFVQEIAATLVAALTLRDHAWPVKDVHASEDRSLTHLSKVLAGVSSDREIRQTYRALKRNVCRSTRQTVKRLKLIDAIVRASETILVELPTGLSKNEGWNGLIAQAASLNMAGDAKVRFKTFIDNLPEFRRRTRQLSRGKAQNPHDTILLAAGIPPQAFLEYIHYLGSALAKYTLIRRVRHKDGSATENPFDSIGKLHVLRTNCITHPGYAPAVQAIFGENDRDEVMGLLDGPSIFLMFDQAGKCDCSSSMYISIDRGKLRETSGMEWLWKWQNIHAILWWMKIQLMYPQNIPRRPDGRLVVSCPFKGTKACPHNAQCRWCRVHPLSLSGFDPRADFCQLAGGGQ